jgi:hypothetical protein
MNKSKTGEVGSSSGPNNDLKVGGLSIDLRTNK